MTVFIAHAEADQPAADALKAFLKTRGLVVETENGVRGFRYLQPGDAVVGLWSQKSMFATHRMQIEKRLLDAWADEQLVLVKLDNAFLPVGVRDLPAVDASFEPARELKSFPDIEAKVREASRRALAATSRPRPEGIGSGWSDSELRPRAWENREEAPAPGTVRFPRPDAPSTAAAPMAKYSARPSAPPKRVKGGSPVWTLLGLVALGAMGWAAWYIAQLEAVSSRNVSDAPLTLPVVVGVAALGALVLSVIGARSFGRRSTSSFSAPKKTPAPAAPAMGPPAKPAMASPPPGPSALFVSYAHADNAQVQPVVAIVEKSGRLVWIDKTGIQAGDGWAGEIVRAIKDAKGILVMCSKHAFESDHVKREIYLADRYKKPMAPVFLEQVQPPDDFEYFFAGVQWLELWKLPEAERAAAIGLALARV